MVDSVPCIKDGKEFLNIKRLRLFAGLSNKPYFHRRQRPRPDDRFRMRPAFRGDAPFGEDFLGLLQVNSFNCFTAAAYAFLISASVNTLCPSWRKTFSRPRVTTGMITFVWEYFSIRSISHRQKDSVSEGGVFRLYAMK